MRILIIEDNLAHIQAAKEQLVGHELTICNDYISAEQLLNQSNEKSSTNNVYAGRNFVQGKPHFEMVLTDLFMPSSQIGNYPAVYEKYKDQEQPYGLVFMLVALRRGVKYLGILTDSDHHSNPMAWALDMLDGGVIHSPERKVIHSYLIGNTKVSKSVEVSWEKNSEGTLSKVKNWLALYERLTSETFSY